MNDLVVGIFVGGRGERLGGVAKGLLLAPSGVRVLERLCTEIAAALPATPVVLVGNAEPYRELCLRAVPDDPSGIGPLGGLRGLLKMPHRCALALPCDLPFIGREFIMRLAAEAPDVDALFVTQEGKRNPLIARYRCARTLEAVERVLARGQRSLQCVLDELGPNAQTLSATETELASLRDWDTPQDIAKG